MPDFEPTLIQYAHAKTWNDAFKVLRDNQAILLTSEAEQFLRTKYEELEAGDLPNGYAAWYFGRLGVRLAVLQVARIHGLDVAWTRIGSQMRARDQEKIDNPNWVPYWKTR